MQSHPSTIIVLYWLDLKSHRSTYSFHPLDPYFPSDHLHLSPGPLSCLQSIPHTTASVLFPKHKSDHICPAQDLSVLPITLRIKFKCFNMTLYDGAHLPLQPLSPSSLCQSMSSYSGLSGPQTGSPSPECTVLGDSPFPSLLTVFPSSFRSQRGCHVLWEVFSDTHLCASLAGTLYHHTAGLSYDIIIA